MHNTVVIIIALSLSLGIYAVVAQRGANIVKLDTAAAAMSAIWGLLELGAACLGYGIGHLILSHEAETFRSILKAGRLAERPAQFWIRVLAGVLLAIVGIRMLLQAFRKKSFLEHRMERVDLQTDSLLSLRICLEALIVGIACGLLNTELILWLSTVFILSVFFAGIGYIGGRAYGALFTDQAVGLGGSILCLLGMLLQLQ